MKGTNVYMGLSICFDDIPKGRRNLITDVPGVLVGHATLSRGDVQTGVTAVLPHSGNTGKLLAGLKAKAESRAGA